MLSSSSRAFFWEVRPVLLRTPPHPLGNPTTPGIEPALLVWQPGITPSGLLFYTGDKFPAWKGNLMVGGVIRGRANGVSGVERVVFNEKAGPGRIRCGRLAGKHSCRN